MKKCFKCHRDLALDMFYKHSQMADGRLNKCKECTKRDASLNYQTNMNDSSYVESQRIRGREKYRRLGYVDKVNIIKNNDSVMKNINRALRVRGFDMNEKEFHHWNYNTPRCGFILTRREHALIHNNLIYDKKSKCFLYNGVLLDTKKKHHKVINKLLRKHDMYRTIVLVELINRDVVSSI